MSKEDQIQSDLGRIFGDKAKFAEPSRFDRFRLAFREFIHPLGFHHPVGTYRWDDRLERLVDEGTSCRVCGRQSY